MKIALKKTSLVDFPGRPGAVFFFTGCNLRCPWCQNQELIELSASTQITELIDLEKGLEHIVKRRSVLGGVVLSGGEPTMQRELPGITEEIKRLGLLVKLDTNGMNPDMLSLLFAKRVTHPDYIALDLKLAPHRYMELLPASQKEICSFNPGEALIESAALIRASGISHEYRTLALPDGVITEKDIEALAPLTDDAPWYFRPFRPGNCLDPAWDSYNEPGAASVKSLAHKAHELGKNAASWQPEPASHP